MEQSNFITIFDRIFDDHYLTMDACEAWSSAAQDIEDHRLGILLDNWDTFLGHLREADKAWQDRNVYAEYVINDEWLEDIIEHLNAFGAEGSLND